MSRPAVVLLLLAGLLAGAGTGCRGSSGSPDADTTDAAPVVDDGPPMRVPCTNSLGTSLTTVFGRLDGYLRAIVPPGAPSCNADTDHVHLQVEANGETYDIAINVGSAGADDVHTTTRDIPLPALAWSEGWHTGVGVNYVSMGVHSTDLTLATRGALVADITADMATVNHISIFGIGYGPDGLHLIHRNDFNHDGLVITQPLSPTTHARMFSFTAQQF